MAVIDANQFSFFPPAVLKTPPLLKYTEAEARALFDDWWAHCWLKVDKGHARAAYVKAITQGRGTPQELIEGADRYAEFLRRNPSRSPKYPQGWLSGDRWLDQLSADDRGSAERSRSAAHLGAARLFGNRGGLR